METLKMHFTIGKNLGIRLHEISLDHLRQYNVKKALETWTKSLRCGNDIAVKLMKMELICDIDTNKQRAIVIPKHEFNQERLAAYPTFDKYSGQGKCPINFCSCNAEYCPLTPDLSDCERYCDKVKELQAKISFLDYKIKQQKTQIGVYESQIFRQKFFEDITCITEQWLLNAKFIKEDYNKYHKNNIVIYRYDNDPTEWQIFVRQGKNVNKYIAKTVGEFRQFLHLNNENYIII